MNMKDTQAQLLKVEDSQDYFVNTETNRQHRGLQDMKLKVVCSANVPSSTTFRRQVPGEYEAVSRGCTSLEETREALLEQKRYWKSKIAELEDQDGRKIKRYERRIEAVEKFIESLEENREVSQE